MLPPVVWTDRDRMNGAGSEFGYQTMLVVPLAARTAYTVWGRVGGAGYLDCVLTVQNRPVADGMQTSLSFGSVTPFGVATPVGRTSLTMRCKTLSDRYHLNPLLMAVPVEVGQETSGAGNDVAYPTARPADGARTP